MNKEIWFLVGSVEFYGEEALESVRKQAQEMVAFWNKGKYFPYPIVLQELGISANKIEETIKKANYDNNVLGLMTWMHTFSPAKSWIKGLKILQKPLLHIATQFNEEVPWESIDMDFMNLNQSAHGDREFGFICKRLEIPRSVVVGHWQDLEVIQEVSQWLKLIQTKAFSEQIRVARFGDNMRNVADTEGDKVAAAIQFGWTVDYYGIGDLVNLINQIPETEVDELFELYQTEYKFEQQENTWADYVKAIKEQGRIELALRKFLIENNYQAFTTNFEDLHGMNQLPGLAVQRLMAEGYGFAGEGDWKTAALVAILKVLANQNETGFMEDYTYNLKNKQEYIVGAHMLEVDPTLAKDQPTVIVSPLGIGNRADPARLVFSGKAGEGIVCSMIHLNQGYQLIINEIEALEIKSDAPKLPVGRVAWRPKPNFKKGVKKWLEAGGGHHTVYSLALTVEELVALCQIIKLDYQLID